MITDGYPNVLYIGRSSKGMVLEPIHLALWNLANVVTCWVDTSRLDRLRSRVARSMTSNLTEPRGGQTGFPIKPILRAADVVLDKVFDRYAIAKPEDMPVEPDLIFVADAHRKMTGMETFSCPKAYYMLDPHISTKRYLDYAHLEDYDHLFITQKNQVDVFRDNGYNNIHWLPWGFDSLVVAGPSRSRDLDVTFIGRSYPGSARDELVTHLDQKFNLEKKRVYLRDMATLIRRSKIVFNKSLKGDLNPRVFESLGAGSLLVTDRIDNGLFELFVEGVHLAAYDSKEELEEKVRYYLDNENERLKIATSGQREVLSKHTFPDRAMEALRICLGTTSLSSSERRLEWIRRSIIELANS